MGYLYYASGLLLAGVIAGLLAFWGITPRDSEGNLVFPQSEVIIPDNVIEFDKNPFDALCEDPQAACSPWPFGHLVDNV